MQTKNTDGDAVELEIPRRGRVAVPWALFVTALGASGTYYWKVQRPLANELGQKEAAIAQLKQDAEDARLDATDAKVAHAVDLEKAQSELNQVRADLARTAAQRESDAKLLQQLKTQAGAGGAEVEGAGDQITVTMVDKILFKSGETELTPQGQEMLRRLGAVFKSTDKLIEVCGHADNQPVKSQLKALYPTNWELSTARATNVVRFLEEQVGIKPRQLEAAGFGSSRPVASNARASGRARNRRIEILLLPNNLKVVKGDFSDEIAAATPAPAPPKKMPAKIATRHHAKRAHLRALKAARAKHASKKRPT